MAVHPSTASWLKAQQWFARDAIGFSLGMRREHGDLVFLPAPFGLGQVLVYHPDHVHTLLVKLADKLEKPEIIKKLVRSSFGDGLLVSEGAKWKRQRKLIQPAFHHGRIGRYGERMVALTEELAATWMQGEVRDVPADMHALTLRIVVDALFKTDISADTEAIARGMQLLGEALAVQSRSPLMAFLPDSFPLPILRRKREAVAGMNQIIYRLIRERKAENEKREDLLSVLLFATDPETGEGMSENQLRDEVMTLFIAGHETTATTLSWALVELARHPAVEERVHAELDAAIGDGMPTADDLSRMPYLQAVIQEVLRLYPPSILIIRRALEDLDLEDGNRIPRGTIIQINQYANHHDPRWFPEPESFQPERWLDEGFEKSLPKGAYIPFGAGPRICVGNGFALMEAPLVLATFCRRFHLENVGKPPEPVVGVAMGFKSPAMMRVQVR